MSWGWPHYSQVTVLSSWLATDEIRKTMASGFPGSSCSQGCLFSCPFSMEYAGTAQNPPDFPWKREPWGPTVKENTKVTFVLLKGGNLQMQSTWFSLQLACLQYFLILNWKYIRDPCGSPAGRQPGMGGFIVPIHNCYTRKQAQFFMSHSSSHNIDFVTQQRC